MSQRKKTYEKKQDVPTHFITTKKIKQNPDHHKIIAAEQHLQDIQNYKTSGSIIRSREKLILEQEKPRKLFFD